MPQSVPVAASDRSWHCRYKDEGGRRGPPWRGAGNPGKHPVPGSHKLSTKPSNTVVRVQTLSGAKTTHGSRADCGELAGSVRCEQISDGYAACFTPRVWTTM